MAIQYSGQHQTSSAKLKVGVAFGLGIIAAWVAGTTVRWSIAPLVGWDVAALIFAVWTWVSVWPLSGKLTAAHALREDPSRAVADGLVLSASLASLAAVVAVLMAASNASGSTRVALIAFGVMSVIIGWVMVHTIFALQYAKTYYGDTPGGVDFADTPEPSYQDFAYLAFTIGMTFQVSDTGFQNTAFRRLALSHSLMSYLFGTVIVATTINLIAGLTK